MKLKGKRQLLKEVQDGQCFASPVKEEEYIEVGKGVVPANTKQCNEWAAQTFEAWMKERNVKKPEDPIPEDLLHCTDAGVVCRYMRYFVLEVHRGDGEQD